MPAPYSLSTDLFALLQSGGYLAADLQAGKTENHGTMDEMHARALQFLASPDGVAAGLPAGAAARADAFFFGRCAQGVRTDFPRCRPQNKKVRLAAGWAELYDVAVFRNPAYFQFLDAIDFLQVRGMRRLRRLRPCHVSSLATEASGGAAPLCFESQFLSLSASSP